MSAEILGIVLSFVVAVGSFVLSVFNLLYTRRKFKTEIRAKFVERAVDKRIETYPELWHISGKAYLDRLRVEDQGRAEEFFDTKWAKEFHKELCDWYFEKGNGLFLNKELSTLFHELRRQIKSFSSFEDHEDIIKKTSKLRTQMKRDLKITTRESESLDA